MSPNKNHPATTLTLLALAACSSTDATPNIEELEWDELELPQHCQDLTGQETFTPARAGGGDGLEPSLNATIMTIDGEPRIAYGMVCDSGTDFDYQMAFYDAEGSLTDSVSMTDFDAFTKPDRAGLIGAMKVEESTLEFATPIEGQPATWKLVWDDGFDLLRLP